jgi:hypothetical protein
MHKSPFLPRIERTTDRQIGSDSRFFGSDPAAPGNEFYNDKRSIIYSCLNQKAEGVKK